MRRLTSVTAIAALAILLLTIPAAASAAEETYVVNSIGDEADAAVGTNGCKTAAGFCSLRAAIEESNASAGERDLIGFTGFDGQLPGSKITLGSALPAITSPVTLNGSHSCVIGGLSGPCVEVAAPSAVSVLTVDNADNVTINGLALTGGQSGINLIHSSQAATITGNWIGVKLDGTAGGNSGAGIFIGPDSNGTVIGGNGGFGEENVISNNGTGIDVLGADNAAIQGNLLGVAPDGVTRAENGKDIEITDSTAAPGFSATGNVIGGLLSAEQAETPACDGACNVISGAASHGIDLQGDGAPEEEAPASGATTIQGNLIGLKAAGTGVIENKRAGIRVGEADTVQIGGATAQVANRINGGETGIQAGPSSQDLRIEANRIGLDAAGTGSDHTPLTEGIAVNAAGTTAGNAATIAGNRIAMAGGNAIELKGSGTTRTTVSDNIIGRGVGGETLTAGTVGIQVTQGSGTTIEGNVVERAHVIGIVLQSSNNRLTGNEVLGTEEDSGIVIEQFGPQASSGNVVGGDTATEENVISGSGSNAIDIVDGADTDNQVLRNTGSDNGGLFIDLGRDGLGNQPTGPNGGIQAPAINSATPTTVSGGGAVPGAVIRVFKKATAQNGEIESFLGEVEADGSGNWSLTYESALPLGTEVGVTQTGFDGTSELAQATTANPPPAPAPPSGGGGPQPVKLGGGPGVEARITKAPKKRSKRSTATFKFKGGPGQVTFECKLDRKPFKKCRSPKKYKHLKPGKHVFKVRAISAGGEVQRTPAVRKFKVLR